MGFTLPRPLSHSSISMYQECPQKYRFKYIDKIPEKPKHFFSYGSSVHNALEFFYDVKAPPAPSLEETLARFKATWISAGYKDAAQEQQYFEDGLRLLTAFHRKHAATFEAPFFVEYAYNLQIDGVPVTGRVDRIDKLPDGRLHVLDYKTGKALPASRVEGDPQLTMYQVACEQLLGAQVARLTFYHVPSLKEQTVERHPTKLVDALRKRVVDTADGITKERFEPRPSEGVCRWCDYKPLCPIYRQPPPPTAAMPDLFSLSPKAAASAAAEDELEAEIDRCGDLLARTGELEAEAAELKRNILARLTEKGYVRAFGKRYEAVRAASEKWEFTDKRKVLEVLRQAGLYEKVLAPSAPKIEALLDAPELDGDVRARLSELGEKVVLPDLKLKPLE